MAKLEKYSFENSLGRLSTAVSRGILSRINRELPRAGLRLSSEEWVVLVFVWNMKGLTQCSLAELISKDRPALTRLVDKLTGKKLILRKADKGDSRARRLSLTPAGRAEVGKAAGVVQNILSLAKAGIAERDIRVCKAVLRRVQINLTARPAALPAISDRQLKNDK
jgi:MarR family transcriptional regulator for hemolysin